MNLGANRLDVFLEHRSSYEKVFSNIHPLFSEIAMLIWSMHDLFIPPGTFEKEIEFLPTWFEIKEKGIRDVSGNLKGEDMLKFKKIILSMNTMIFLSLLNNSPETTYPKCSVYGLWPAFNRVTIHPTDVFLATAFNLMPFANLLESQAIRNCGSFKGYSIRYKLSPYDFDYLSAEDYKKFGPYGTKAQVHLEFMQKRYTTLIEK